MQICLVEVEEAGVAMAHDSLVAELEEETLLTVQGSWLACSTAARRLKGIEGWRKMLGFDSRAVKKVEEEVVVVMRLPKSQMV